MILTAKTYCPALGWRQGEYQALLRLADATKDRIAPIITVPPIEYDFEERRAKRTVEAHIEPFAKRFSQKWKDRFAWVAPHPELQKAGVGEAINVTQRLFEDLRDAKCNVAPLCNLADATLATTEAAIIAEDKRGCALRVTLEDFMRPSFETDGSARLAALGVTPDDVDIILDMLSPAFEPYDVFAKILAGKLQASTLVQKARNFILLGSAIPGSLKDIAMPWGEIPRHDWLFYNALRSQTPAGSRQPTYGDYTTVSPGFVVLDMRKIKVAGKIVYADQKRWLVRKGGAFRPNPAQMHDHCAAIVGTSAFGGAAYCHGDDYIAKCAVKTEGPSTLTRWKQVAINRHMTLTVNQIASLGASA
ncbi:MAG: beta family protein [Hyphomonadaceae bacterium]